MSNKTDRENFDSWKKYWQANGDQVPWQVTGPHKGLVNNITALTDNKPNRHVLVPLCGTSDDLIWLADQGHTVVGVEIVRDAIKIFFDKNKLEYEVSAINIAPSGAYIYKAKDKNISIVEVNIFNFQKSIAGDFDAVWDRSALFAVTGATNSNEEEVQLGMKYLQVLKNVLKPDGRVLMETILFDEDEATKAGGLGPHLLSDDQLKSICGRSWTMEKVDLISINAGEKFQRKVFDYDIHICVHLLIPSKNNQKF